MNSESWDTADDYLAALFTPPDAALAACLGANAQEGLPPIDVSPLQGKMLHLLAGGSRHILEIGALGGYSTIWLARALAAGGRLISLELNPKHAAVARANIARASLSDRVRIIEGPALESLARLPAEEPFDFIFIDADKTGYPAYLAAALKLSRPGTIIVADNVVRKGQVADAEDADANVQGARTFLALAAKEPRLSATVIQTVGAKGHDGFLLARVL
jgi:predicted O-methyltransferase YrrM